MSEGRFCKAEVGECPICARETAPHAPPRGGKRPCLTAVLLLVLGLAPGLTGCGGDDYCGAVEDHQAELTDAAASGSPAALLEALPIFRDLAGQAPDDIRDDWKAFLGPLEDLDHALRDADVDPTTYDRTDLPDDLTEEQRRQIEDAAAALADPAVAQALDGVQQQAKDVCHTPLSL